MDIYRVSFIGHRQIREFRKIEERLREIIRDLISTKEYVEFYMGRQGDFDILAASVVKSVQKELGRENNSLILALSYKIKDEEYYAKYYDEVVLQIDTSTHFKSAITKRNQCMICGSDLLIAYVEKNYGGAYTALRYAEKKQVKTVNIAIDN